jgi:ubiquinone biosynthesis protein COQ9
MSRGQTQRKDKLIEALLPAVPFDGWTRAALRAAAKQAGVDAVELAELFPRGARDAVAWFSAWADRKTLAALASRRHGRLGTSARVALGVRARLELLRPHREAVRRALSLLALPGNLALGAKLLYDTVDTLWFAAGDRSTDFNFYTKRALLAAVYAATSLYWLDDRSANAAATREFLDRRLREVLAIPRLRAAAARFADPLGILRRVRTAAPFARMMRKAAA